MDYIIHYGRIFAYDHSSGLTYYFDSNKSEWQISQVGFHAILHGNDLETKNLTEQEVKILTNGKDVSEMQDKVLKVLGKNRKL